MSNFMKIRPVGAELFLADKQTDRQADMAKLIIASCKFSNAPKNGFEHGGRSYLSFGYP
jgi:hypothetical protein